MLDPLTVAVNCCVAPVNSDDDVGEIEMATTVGALTLTVAEAVLPVFAALVAVTV